MFDSVWGGGQSPPPERNTALNKGRKCFHCLGAPNNLIRPCADRLLYSHIPTTPAVTPVYESMACIGKCRVVCLGSDGGFFLQDCSVLRHFVLNV